MAKPSKHRLDELLAAIGSTNEIAPNDYHVLGEKIAKGLLKHEPILTSNSSRSVGQSVINATVPETHSRRNSAAVLDCVRHAWQAR
jgi:hypothetical protein